MILVVRPLLTGRDRDDQGTAPIILRFLGDSGPTLRLRGPRLAHWSRANYSRYGTWKSPK
jgi:hypothetical protein